MKKNIPYLVAAVLLWLLFAQAVRGAVISSLTFDEGPHLAVGYATLRTGDFRLQPVHIHPPLANVLAAAPLLLDPSLPDPRSIPGWDIASLSAVTDTIVWQHRPPDGIALAGRLPIILLAVLLGAFVYRWAADLAGWKAGLLALFLYALDPNIVAHAQVITTDMGVTAFGFVALYCLFKYQISDFKFQRWWLGGAGIALGAALATKVSAGLLAPLLAVVVLLTGREAFRLRVWHVVVMGLITFVVVWAVYGFQVDRVPGLPFPVPAATQVKIYLSLLQHYDEGHPSFLMGMNSTRGWWYYFPVAFLVKTPLPTLILVLVSIMLAVGYGVSGSRDGKPASHKSQVAAWTLGLFPVVHFVTTLWSSVDIGYRHLLPVLPFLFVFIGTQIAHHLSRIAYRLSQRSSVTLRPAAREYAKVGSPRRLVTWSLGLLTTVLLVWYVVGTARIFPHDLAYFNELAGGPDGGYNWLVDSNLDWGQNLKELKTWLDAHGVERVFLSQFSPSRPEVYGIQATLLPPSPRAEPFASFNPAPGWYAIGATTLQGAYTPDVDTFAYFHAMTPTARIGHAMFVYHVPEQPRGEWVAQCARPSPLLDAEEIKVSFGRADLRLVQFDCSTSWWYPANNTRGWYVNMSDPSLPVDVHKWYTSSHLVSKGYRMGGTVYNVMDSTPPQSWQRQVTGAPGNWPLAQALTQGARVTAPVTTTGPLRFEGFWLESDEASVRQWNRVNAFSVWRVMRPAEHPLSIMAHLLDGQGRVIADFDGLGVPTETWQTGDLIVRAHYLNVPIGTVPGTYWIETGLYRLDTLERYRILQEGQVVGDRLMLTSIEVAR